MATRQLFIDEPISRQIHPSLSPLGDLGVAVARSSPSVSGLPRGDYEQTRAMTGYTSGPGGGYFVPQLLSDALWDKARAIDGPLNRCTFFPCSGVPFTVPAIDERNRQTARQGGIKALWSGLNDTGYALSAAGLTSQGTLNGVPFNPNRLIIFSSPISNDLIADAALLGHYMDVTAANDFRYVIETAMVAGTGVGMPLGVINSPACIVVDKEGGQSAGTINITNLHKLWSRMWGFCRRNAVWLVGDDTQLILDQVFENSTTPTTMYQPQGSVGNKFPLLKGRPVLPCEACSVVGQPGDIILCDFSQYGLAVKRNPDGTPSMAMDFGNIPPEVASNIEAMSSGEPLFDLDQTYFRFKMRIDGKLMWSGPITTQASGSTTTVGPAVILATR